MWLRSNNSHTRKWNLNMPTFNNAMNPDDQTRSASIREELEERARTLNPKLARRLVKRLEARKTNDHRSDTSARRVMRWQDRILLSLSIILLTLLVIRAETAVADQPECGLLLKNAT